MNKRKDYLKTLGLSEDASWEEISQSYKDLIRVWHPDRFQGNERLRIKAEQESQRLNEAMAELRKLGKEAPQTMESNARDTDSTVATPSKTPTARDTSHTTVASLTICQRPAISLTRTLAALGVTCLMGISLANEHDSAARGAFSASVIFVFIEVGARNLILFLIPSPIVRVNQAGLFTVRTGTLGWNDVSRVWADRSARSSSLHIQLSPHYLKKRNRLVRSYLAIRSLITSKHLSIPFNGLDGEATQVLDALNQHRPHDVSCHPPSAPTPSRLLRCAHIICVLSATAGVARVLLWGAFTMADWLPFVGVFFIVRLASGVIIARRTLPT